MTDGLCDICKKRERRLVAVVSKARLFHVCQDCFFERFMARRESGVSMFEEVSPPRVRESRLLEYLR
ncbi:MAG TPA: hypothetical protein ENN85_02740 [Methanoculleus sp.]|nr:hypothetical protein [Methanoculleus sp.]